MIFRRNKHNKLKIRIKYFNDQLTRIEKIHIGDWIDLRAAKTISLKKGDFYEEAKQAPVLQ